MIGQVFRFGLVGCGATLVHLGVAGALLAVGLPVTVANRLAFGCALCVGFVGHALYTFPDHDGSKRQAFYKYLLGASAGYCVNELILALLLSVELVPPAAALVLAILSVAAFSFVLSRLWTFRTSPPEGS